MLCLQKQNEVVFFSIFSQGQATKNGDCPLKPVTSGPPMIYDVGYDRYFANHTL